MELNNEFTVAADPDSTWKLLTDLERVAPCMPGATIDGRDGDAYLGTVKVRVGPISAKFNGRATFVEQDEKARTAVISMAGKDPKGSATANAVMRARLEEQPDGGTKVAVATDLDITGRMAQFGRGAITEVSSRILDTFTQNLGKELLNPASGQAAEATDATASAPPAASRPDSGPASIAGTESVAGTGDRPAVATGPTLSANRDHPGELDLVGAVLGPLLGRAKPQLIAIGALAVGFLVGRLTGRRSARHTDSPQLTPGVLAALMELAARAERERR